MNAPQPDIYVAALDGSTAPTTIGAAGVFAWFSPPDHLLAVRDGQLLRWTFDAATARVLSGI